MKKVTPEVHKLIMERIVAILKMVDDFGTKATKEQISDLSEKLYDGFYDFFTREKKHSKEIESLKKLMVGKDKERVAKQINSIVARSHEAEKDMVYQIIHKWEEGVKRVQAN